MKKIILYALLIVMILSMSACAKKEKYTTTVFDDNIKVREYKDRNEYLFFDGMVSLTIPLDSQLKINSLVTLEETGDIFIPDMEQYGDISFYVYNDETKFSCLYTITKDTLIDYYTVLIENDHVIVGKHCDSDSNESDIEGLESLTFKLD